jgi:branched-chain amino acid transport system ATP-binding protein
MPVLSLRDVHVHFGGITAVDGLSLDVHQAEIVGLIGPNGAGKTVTFNVATGLQAPDAGAVILDGDDITHLPTHVRARMGLGRTFQVVQLFDQLDVLDNVALAGHRFTLSGFLSDGLRLPYRRQAMEEAHERAWAALEFCGLTRLAALPVGTLPIGQARLVELARALCLQPKVLLLDEPASGLDSSETAELVALLAHIRATTHAGILLVEHDLHVVDRLCDHVEVMDFGHGIASGSPAEVRDDPHVRASYLGVT